MLYFRWKEPVYGVSNRDSPLHHRGKASCPDAVSQVSVLFAGGVPVFSRPGARLLAGSALLFLHLSVWQPSENACTDTVKIALTTVECLAGKA
ncbi:hypothetical protein TNIN_365811 [Trichonephila inaurata madagascariensis]|uniref:Uncharacterized protein n=1 Tax=Trichonephila inaurata madagascariensis TaxID=2747483 RepID=A0A8X6YG54_9ARAC|nr:hypothetical protein TNIN_365811 [Trichonephila inaurata madagascariensis]